MVQAAGHQVVDVVIVGHLRMTAEGAMAVLRRVAGLRGLVGATVVRRPLQGVDFMAVAVGVVQMAVVQVVDMVAVAHRQVAAARAVDVAVAMGLPVVQSVEPPSQNVRKDQATARH
jgi:hypothetical protein